MLCRTGDVLSMGCRLSAGIATTYLLTVIAGSAYSSSVYTAEESWQHTYLENTGAVESSHTWIVRKRGERVETHWITPDKAYFNLCDATGATLEWRFRGNAADIRAWRSGDRIRLEGTRDGKTVNEDIEIDASPWFQPLSYALGRFSQSQRDSIAFWTIRPDNLDVVKLRASNLGDEQVTTKAGTFTARKISISLNGFLSHFWQAHYWFRHTDGLFVRYRGANGLPGTPTTTIQLGG